MQQQPEKPKQRRISTFLLGAFVLISLSVLILLQTSNLWKDFSVETASDTLLLYALSSLNFIAFVIFGFIFLRSIIKLMRERRAFQLGAKIKTRLLIYFAAISILPIIAMSGFSYLFMNRALERWFSQIPENVVREAKAVQAQSLAEQASGFQNAARMIALSLEGREVTTADLDRLAAAGDVIRIEIISNDNKSLVASSNKLTADDAGASAEIVLIREGEFDNPLLHDGVGIDAASAEMSGGRLLVIVPNLRNAASVSQMVDTSLAELDRLKEKDIEIRQIGLLTLGVLTFLLIFAATWTAFYIARGLTVPIKALAEGADKIAQGDLSHRVDVFAEDELALLVGTFNQMSEQLERSSAEISEGRKYIETVLQSLPTGVISFDAGNRVSTINRAAINIFRLENDNFGNLELKTLVSEDNRVILERLISRAKRIGHASEQTKLTIENSSGRSDGDASLPVALIATALADGNGAVLVIEDLSELIAAQRASAWQEVARRMAHEIKNPLTPIQLSAERIAKKMSGSPVASSMGSVPLSAEPVNRIVKEGTDTILREVESLKSMVDEFSRFARLPDAKLEPGNVNEIVEQVVAMYKNRFDDISIKANLATELPRTMVDGEQLKRVFVNLIENAIEAFNGDGAFGEIEVSTRHEVARDLIVAEVSDNGDGIDPADFQKLFQPYFSTKGRGTGLGLAIVNRIVSDHGGRIKAAANTPRGAKFIVEIPVVG
ncbi:MAG TPA: ATP-binding protein [Pyrinomonadaceae bacterium]|nr:ATP-binding protein [Pyrinomonadaceae bacterium]